MYWKLFCFLPSTSDCYLGKQMLQHIVSWEETNACYPSSRKLNKRHPLPMSNAPKTPLCICLTPFFSNGPMQTPKAHKNLLSEGSAQKHFQLYTTVTGYGGRRIAPWKGTLRTALLINRYKLVKTLLKAKTDESAIVTDLYKCFLFTLTNSAETKTRH